MKFKGMMIAAMVAGLASVAMAQDAGKQIHTGGQGGAYNNTFCPPLPTSLAKAYFQGYTCTPSGGTPDNIAKVLANPTNIGFAQFDIFARAAAEKPEDFAKLSVIRNDLACEGLWMVTKNDRFTEDAAGFGTIQGLARRIPFILPGANSGSTATFNYLKTLDPEGLGRASNITFTENDSSSSATKKMIEQIAAGNDGAVGFFVQFADPENANIKLMLEKKLRIVPVASREILRAQANNESVYRLETFAVSSGWGGKDVSTSCTPVAIFTGTPEAVTAANPQNTNAALDQKDLIAQVKAIKREELLPADNRIASLLRQARRMTDKLTEDAMVAAENARKRAGEMMQ